MGTGSTLNVTRGSQLTAHDCVVNVGSLNLSSSGDATFVTTQVGVTAGPARLNVRPAAGAMLNSNGTFDIGVGSTGLLNIQSGGAVSHIGAADSRIGVMSGSTGTVTVNGAGSSWTTSNADVEIGSGGTGTLAIANGGVVSFGTAL